MSNYFNSMSERTFRIVVVLLFFVIFFVTMFMLAAGGATASTTGPRGWQPQAPAWTFGKVWEPCTNDEPQAKRCVWDARHNGNGTGHSYIQTNAGKVIFTDHRTAHWLLLPTYAS